MISASDQLKLLQSKSVMNQMTEAVCFFKTCHFCHEGSKLKHLERSDLTDDRMWFKCSITIDSVSHKLPYSWTRTVSSALCHFHERSPFCGFFLHQTLSKRDCNVSEKAQRTLFIVSPVLIGLLTQFKNWNIV